MQVFKQILILKMLIEALSAKIAELYKNQPVTASGAAGAVDIMKGYSGISYIE
jgi:hypothetical protein